MLAYCMTYRSSHPEWTVGKLRVEVKELDEKLQTEKKR